MIVAGPWAGRGGPGAERAVSCTKLTPPAGTKRMSARAVAARWTARGRFRLLPLPSAAADGRRRAYRRGRPSLTARPNRRWRARPIWPGRAARLPERAAAVTGLPELG